MDIQKIRKRYPQYDDMSNRELAERLHQRFYPDMSFETFAKKINFQETTKPKVDMPNVVDYAKGALDVVKATGEVSLSMASNALIWPFSKAYGLMALPWGAEAAKMAEEDMASLAYQPKTELAQQSMQKAGQAIDWFLTPTRMAEKATKKYAGERAAYAVGALGEIGQFAAIGPIKAKIKKVASKAVNSSSIKTFKEFWQPYSKVPQAKDALIARYRGMGKLAQAERIVKTHIKDKLDKYPSEVKQDIFRYLDGQIEAKMLPKEAVRTAVSLRERTKQIGKILVEHDLISPEAFEKMKGRYVHYMYARHVLGEDVPIHINPTGKLNLSYSKHRKDLSTEQRKALGLIEDASVAVPMGLGKALGDIAKHNYLETLASNDQWVYSPSLVKVPRVGAKPVTMGIGKLVDEVKTYEKMLHKTPTPEIKAQYEMLNTVLNDAINRMGEAPKDFVSLPTTRSYGPLAGAFIRKSIADDLKPVVSSFENQGRLFQTLMSIEQQGVALMKLGKVATNPPTAVRNIVSNILQNNMRGRALHKIPGDIVSACSSMLKKDKYYREFFKHGGFKTNWAVTEINDVLNAFRKTEHGNHLDLLNSVKKVGKYYGRIDDINKLAIYKQMRKAGHDKGTSVLEAMKWGMDYSLASRSVKSLRKHIMPFISYQYKVAPLITESLINRPWVIGKYLAVPYLAIEATKNLHDLTDKDWEKLKKDLPSYIKRSGSYMIMPNKSPDGHWQWVNLEYFYPWGNYLSLFRDIKEKDAGEVYRDLGISNPYFDIARMVASAKEDKPMQHPYYGTDIYNRLDPPHMKVAKTMEAIAYTWLPSAISRHGALGYSFSAARQEEDKWGREVTPSQAIGRWFGVNIVQMSPHQTAVIKKAKKNQLKSDLFRIFTDPRKSKEEKQEARKTYTEKVRELYK